MESSSPMCWLLIPILLSFADHEIFISGQTALNHYSNNGGNTTSSSSTDIPFQKESQETVNNTDTMEKTLQPSPEISPLNEQGVSDKPIRPFVSAEDSLYLHSAIIGPIPKPIIGSQRPNYEFTPEVSLRNPRIDSSSSVENYTLETHSPSLGGDKVEPLSFAANKSQQFQNVTEEGIAEDINCTDASSIVAETNYSNISTTQEGTEKSPTPDKGDHLVSVPFCCFDGQLDVCSDNSTHPKLRLPIAIGHCKPPKMQFVSPKPVRNTTCSVSNRMKIAMNEERKIVSTERELALSFNQQFISEFCVEVDFETSDQWWAVICSSDTTQHEKDPCPNDKCLRKCCPEGYILHNDSCICYEGYSQYSNIAFNIRNGTKNTLLKHTKFGMPECQQTLMKRSKDNFGEVNKDTDFRAVITRNSKNSESAVYYCVEDALDNEDNKIYQVEISCHEPQEGVWKTLRRILIPAGLVVSCVFLSCTLLCHLCVAPLRDLHGLCLAAYMGALLVADASLFTVKLYSEELTESACIAVGTIVQVSFISTFMWLNVICFDIWNYVGQTVQAVPLYRSPRDLNWFIAYGGYAWGIPLLFGCVIGGIQGQNPHHNVTLVPHFALNNCWFNSSEFWETFLLFYGPIGVLLVVNTVFLFHTGLRLYSLHHSRCCRSTYNQEHQPLHRPHLNEFWERFTLFAILACCWGTELVSWLSGSGDSAIWGVTDTINAFQGVFIFFIILRSTKKRRLLKHTMNKWLSTIRQESSTSWTHIGFSHTKPGHLINNLRNTVPKQKTFNGILCKEKLTSMSSFENMVSDDDVKDDDPQAKEVNISDLDQSPNLSSVWTIPQWKSFKSKSYFPSSSHCPNDSFVHSNDLFFESFGDLQSIYSPYSQDRNSGSSTDDVLQPDRNAFSNWNLLRNKSGSITFTKDENGQDSEGDVICQGLRQRDP